jgi:hypothetical protein
MSTLSSRLQSYVQPFSLLIYESECDASILCCRTIVQDTRAMAETLATIRASIVNDNLQTAELVS